MNEVTRFSGFHDYYGQTSVHPLAASFTSIVAILSLALPRRFALVPLLVAAATLPMAQRVVVAGADFTLLRIIVLVLVLRVLFRGEWRDFNWNRLDTGVLLWATSSVAVMTIHFGSFDVFVNRLGWAYDLILVYFLARLLIRDWGDVFSLSKAAAFLSVPMAAVFLYEWSTQYNVFHVFGGVREITWIREGRLRCQGPFAHPIVAGVFWASMLPLIWMLWGRESKALVLTATGAGILIISATASATPLLAAQAALLGAVLYVLRRRRTAIWVLFFVGVFLLHLVMNAPVWHLISRVDIVGGSTGWHRFIIFDTFVQHFSDWYLTGYATPMDWRWQMRDVTNQFVGVGLSGGLLTLVMFLLVLFWAFGNVGQSLRKTEASPSAAADTIEWPIWLVGVAMFVHVVSFWGLSYFGQITVVLYLHLGLAGAVAATLVKPVPEVQKGTSQGTDGGRVVLGAKYAVPAAKISGSHSSALSVRSDNAKVRTP